MHLDLLHFNDLVTAAETDSTALPALLAYFDEDHGLEQMRRQYENMMATAKIFSPMGLCRKAATALPQILSEATVYKLAEEQVNDARKFHAAVQADVAANLVDSFEDYTFLVNDTLNRAEKILAAAEMPSEKTGSFYIFKEDLDIILKAGGMLGGMAEENRTDAVTLSKKLQQIYIEKPQISDDELERQAMAAGPNPDDAECLVEKAEKEPEAAAPAKKRKRRFLFGL